MTVLYIPDIQRMIEKTFNVQSYLRDRADVVTPNSDLQNRYLRMAADLDWVCGKLEELIEQERSDYENEQAAIEADNAAEQSSYELRVRGY